MSLLLNDPPSANIFMINFIFILYLIIYHSFHLRNDFIHITVPE